MLDYQTQRIVSKLLDQLAELEKELTFFKSNSKYTSLVKHTEKKIKDLKSDIIAERECGSCQ